MSEARTVVRFDVTHRRVWREDRELRLTRRELDLLVALTTHAQVIVSREQLLTEVWGSLDHHSRALDETLSRLRRRLGDDPRHPRLITAHRNRGLRLELEAIELVHSEGSRGDDSDWDVLSMAVDRVPVAAVMGHMARSHPVLRSGLDLEQTFAGTVSELAPTADIRFERRGPEEPEGPVAEQTIQAGGRTLVKLRYATTSWAGTDGLSEDVIALRGQPLDAAGRDFLFDVERLEGLVAAGAAGRGVAVLLTNQPLLWLPPVRNQTRSPAYALHQGSRLTGRMMAATQAGFRSGPSLRGEYVADWHLYSFRDERGGEFCWLAWEIGPATVGVDAS